MEIEDALLQANHQQITKENMITKLFLSILVIIAIICNSKLGAQNYVHNKNINLQNSHYFHISKTYFSDNSNIAIFINSTNQLVLYDLENNSILSELGLNINQENNVIVNDIKIKGSFIYVIGSINSNSEFLRKYDLKLDLLDEVILNDYKLVSLDVKDNMIVVGTTKAKALVFSIDLQPTLTIKSSIQEISLVKIMNNENIILAGTGGRIECRLVTNQIITIVDGFSNYNIFQIEKGGEYYFALNGRQIFIIDHLGKLHGLITSDIYISSCFIDSMNETINLLDIYGSIVTYNLYNCDNPISSTTLYKKKIDYDNPESVKQPPLSTLVVLHSLNNSIDTIDMLMSKTITNIGQMDGNFILGNNSGIVTIINNKMEELNSSFYRDSPIKEIYTSKNGAEVYVTQQNGDLINYFSSQLQIGHIGLTNKDIEAVDFIQNDKKMMISYQIPNSQKSESVFYVYTLKSKIFNRNLNNKVVTTEINRTSGPIVKLFAIDENNYLYLNGNGMIRYCKNGNIDSTNSKLYLDICRTSETKAIYLLNENMVAIKLKSNRKFEADTLPLNSPRPTMNQATVGPHIRVSSKEKYCAINYYGYLFIYDLNKNKLIYETPIPFENIIDFEISNEGVLLVLLRDALLNDYGVESTFDIPKLKYSYFNSVTKQLYLQFNTGEIDVWDKL